MTTTSSVDAVMDEDDSGELVTGEAVALDLRATSFVLRAAGAIIDWFVYLGGYIAIVLVFAGPATQLGLDQAILTALALALLVICIVVIPVAVETLSQGKSLGKLAVGARIVRDDGGSIGFRHAFIRALTGVLETYMSFGGFAAIVALLNRRAKRLGDLVAGTYSQNERVSRFTPPVFGVPIPLQTWALTADVARMPDALARRVATFLAEAGGFTPDTRQRLSRSLADEVAAYVSPVPTSDAELFLAAVASLRRDREFAALHLQQQGLARLASVLGGMPRGFPDRG
jgi:uncharacterized RDD family membrane protein YckC